MSHERDPKKYELVPKSELQTDPSGLLLETSADYGHMIGHFECYLPNADDVIELSKEDSAGNVEVIKRFKGDSEDGSFDEPIAEANSTESFRIAMASSTTGDVIVNLRQFNKLA